MENCVKYVQAWMRDHFLKMNSDKTEVLVIRPKNSKVALQLPSLTVGNTCVTPSEHCRNIGVIMDSHATMQRHVNATCRGAYFHLRNIARIKNCLDNIALKDIIRSLITTKLDYSNSLLYGLPQYIINKLQHVQNSAAHLITGTRKRDHIMPVLKSLHWLPIYQRTKFKILLLVHKAIKKGNPIYLQELLHHYVPTQSLRSSQSNLLVVPMSKSRTYHDRAFSIAGPKVWNSLPAEIKDIDSTASFKAQLKTFLFNETYNSNHTKGKAL